MLRKIGFWLLVAITTFLVLVTLASFTTSNQWWVRLWDYPRLAIFTLAGISTIIAAVSLRRRRRWVIQAFFWP